TLSCTTTRLSPLDALFAGNELCAVDDDPLVLLVALFVVVGFSYQHVIVPFIVLAFLLRSLSLSLSLLLPLLQDIRFLCHLLFTLWPPSSPKESLSTHCP
ncbi:hypothetical protein SERLA73DRAFT_186109, partial [Serpula lacrymans var. lacrymans S7.3]